MQPLLRLSHSIQRVSRGLGHLAALCGLALILVGAYNALARYAGKSLGLALTSNGLVELQWYLFSMMFLLGAPWALRQGAHVRVDIVYERYGERGRAWTNLIGTLLLLLPFAALGIYACWDFAADSIASREMSNDPGGLARWPIKALLPAAFGVLGLQGLAEVIGLSAFLLGKGPNPSPPTQADDGGGV
ncbi:MAG: TRAP transporter small permease subunit [Planctomycetes bacterium]|nr:TRAP transporter small permease subunit [Planctomycetota bacterium]HPF15124.1 TRAP transporter small permease subunit [Planctomycetota bacterium]HRV80699.1 TRAP transporter small permease subunit [Planctomycetota bacterium]